MYQVGAAKVTWVQPQKFEKVLEADGLSQSHLQALITVDLLRKLDNFFSIMSGKKNDVEVESKSGAFFHFTHYNGLPAGSTDRPLLIKSMRNTEKDRLMDIMKMLPAKHYSQSNCLLVRVYGVVVVALAGKPPVDLLIMEDVRSPQLAHLPGARSVEFDLKGAPRETKLDAKFWHTDMVYVGMLKERNMIIMQRDLAQQLIELPPDLSTKLLAQLKVDTRLLMTN